LGSPEQLARARRGQVRYWQVMLLQPFGHTHQQMARGVANAHYRIGLEPGPYVQSYRFLLNALTMSLQKSVPANDRRLPVAVLTLQRLILEDIELVIRLAASLLPDDVGRTPRDDVHVKGVGNVRTWLLSPRTG